MIALARGRRPNRPLSPNSYGIITSTSDVKPHMLEVIRKSLKVSFNGQVVDELLEAYEDAKRRFYAGDLGPNAVAGGRFCEAAFRLLEEAVRGVGNFTALAGSLPRVDTLMGQLASLRTNSPIFALTWQQDSVGLHIPRALRIIYDIRNNRDAAHLADNFDPNQQDATLVVSVLDWVMAEFIRLSHNVSADRAQQIVQDLITRKVPVIQDFNGYPKVLKTGLSTEQFLLALLYYRGARGALWHELHKWMPRQKLSYLQAVLRQLVEDSNRVHFNENIGVYEITAVGRQYVEKNKLLD